MEMHQVRYFLAVARLLNFTRAAEECNVAQPSLTRAIQKLEGELGGLLFRRERNLTHLTELGRMMHPHLEQTYNAAQAAKALAKGLGKDQLSPLELGVASSVSIKALGRVSAEVSSRLQGFSLTIVEGSNSDLLEQLMRGELQLAIFEMPAHPPERMDAWPLYHNSYGLFGSKDIASSATVNGSLPDFSAVNWIGCKHAGCDLLIDRAQQRGEEIVFRHQAASTYQARLMAEAGLGCVILPLGDPGPSTLVQIAADGWPISSAVVVATIAGRQRSLAAEAFLRAARAAEWTMNGPADGTASESVAKVDIETRATV